VLPSCGVCRVRHPSLLLYRGWPGRLGEYSPDPPRTVSLHIDQCWHVEDGPEGYQVGATAPRARTRLGWPPLAFASCCRLSFRPGSAWVGGCPRFGSGWAPSSSCPLYAFQKAPSFLCFTCFRRLFLHSHQFYWYKWK
jgi:hypothetical protein